jgi:hypothetical protein
MDGVAVVARLGADNNAVSALRDAGGLAAYKLGALPAVLFRAGAAAPITIDGVAVVTELI